MRGCCLFIYNNCIKAGLINNFILDAWIFLDAHERSISVAFNAIKNFTLYSRSFNFMIPLTTELSMMEKNPVIMTENMVRKYQYEPTRIQINF